MPTTARTEAPTFEEYATASWPSLYRRAYLLTGNHADAEDLAQQTLIKAHGAWARVSGSDSPNAYVRKILTNTFLSLRRPRGRRLEVLAGDHAPEPVAPAPDGPEDRMALWPHIQDLPPRQRAVVVLRYYEDLSEAEIAAALGITAGTVKSQASKALTKLRTTMSSVEGRDR